MLDTVVNLFTRRDPKREASLALTRIISRYDMQRMSFEEGILEERRSREERYVALGVWLFPINDSASDEKYIIEKGVPAVSHNVRAEGFGIMTPIRLGHDRFLVATPIEEDSGGWRFFECSVRHNTQKPGGWYQMGVQVEQLVSLDSDQRVAFREHIADVQSSSSGE